MIITKPDPSEFPEFFSDYIELVPNEDVFRAMESQTLAMQAFLSEIPEEKENSSYEDGKWTIKDVIGHIIDSERILAYAALRFSRNDKTEIPGFNSEEYVKHSDSFKLSLYTLAHNFGRVRDTNLVLFRTFSEEQLNRKGILNGKEVSVRALIYFIAGHALHHIQVINKLYLKKGT
jgi:uncharacterized damage-inducible protein DinB